MDLLICNYSILYFLTVLNDLTSLVDLTLLIALLGQK